MVVWFNFPAIKSLFGSSGRMLVPHMRVSALADIPWARLRAAGARAALFDKDNTLTLPHVDDRFGSEEAREAVARAADALDGVAVFSNSAGSSDDAPLGLAAGRVEEALGVPVVRHFTKKPDGAKAVLAHFASVPAAAIVLVGDRITTDVAFANTNGMFSILLDPPLCPTADKPVIRWLRSWERRWLQRNSTLSPKHQPIYQKMQKQTAR